MGRIETGGSEFAGDRMLREERIERQEVLSRLFRRQKAHRDSRLTVGWTVRS
jgi:hypothetical protein